MYRMTVALAWPGDARIHAVWLPMAAEMVAPHTLGSRPLPHSGYATSFRPRKLTDHTTSGNCDCAAMEARHRYDMVPAT
jgi:hypothetical protein